MADTRDMTVEDITEEQAAKEKKEEQQELERERRRQRALRVRRRLGTKTPTKTSTANARLRAQVAKMEADMSAMKDLVERAATPKKAGIAGTHKSAEGTAKSGVSNSILGSMVPRNLAPEIEEVQKTPVGVGMTRGDRVGNTSEKEENRRKLIEEKQRELMALLAAEENEEEKEAPRMTGPVIVGDGHGDGLGGHALTRQPRGFPSQEAEGRSRQSAPQKGPRRRL